MNVGRNFIAKNSVIKWVKRYHVFRVSHRGWKTAIRGFKVSSLQLDHLFFFVQFSVDIYWWVIQAVTLSFKNVWHLLNLRCSDVEDEKLQDDLTTFETVEVAQRVLGIDAFWLKSSFFWCKDCSQFRELTVRAIEWQLLNYLFVGDCVSY